MYLRVYQGDLFCLRIQILTALYGLPTLCTGGLSPLPLPFQLSCKAVALIPPPPHTHPLSGTSHTQLLLRVVFGGVCLAFMCSERPGVSFGHDNRAAVIRDNTTATAIHAQLPALNHGNTLRVWGRFKLTHCSHTHSFPSTCGDWKHCNGSMDALLIVAKCVWVCHGE